MLLQKKALLFVFSLLLSFSGALAQTEKDTLALGEQKQENEALQEQISEGELIRFAHAFQGIVLINREAQEEFHALLEKEGMEVARFNQLHESLSGLEEESAIPAQELEKYQMITKAIETLNIGYRERIANICSEYDFTKERYQKLAMEVLSDPEFEERFKRIFEE